MALNRVFCWKLPPLCTLFREVCIVKKAHSYAVFQAFCVFLRVFSLCVPIPYIIYTRKRAQKLPPVFCENLFKSNPCYYVSVLRTQRKQTQTDSLDSRISTQENPALCADSASCDCWQGNCTLKIEKSHYVTIGVYYARCCLLRAVSLVHTFTR